MKILASLLLIVALVLAPYTVELTVEAKGGVPWKTFSGSVSDAVQSSPGSCGPGKEAMFAVFEKDGVTWLYWAGDNGRFVFAEMGPDGKPVRIYTGKQLPSPDHDVIRVTESHAYDADGRDARGPCAELYPDNA